MNSLSIPRTQPKRARGLLVALGLMLVVALLIPQLTMADHVDTDPSQFDLAGASPAGGDASSSSSSGIARCDGSSELSADEAEACDWFDSLLVSYAAGELEYNAPGR